MKTATKTLLALALTLTATACDPYSYVPGRSDGSNQAIPCDPGQNDFTLTNAETEDGPSLNASAPIVDPKPNDQF